MSDGEMDSETRRATVDDENGDNRSNNLEAGAGNVDSAVWWNSVCVLAVEEIYNVDMLM